tara:strand:- start:10810 stop:10986 length:177 start_codon:yes stop_codon:yes gene_type:complete
MEKLSGKRKYPEPLEYDEWLRQQNFFLKAQNDSLRTKLNEYKEYTKYLAERLKILESE